MPMLQDSLTYYSGLKCTSIDLSVTCPWYHKSPINRTLNMVGMMHVLMTNE